MSKFSGSAMVANTLRTRSFGRKPQGQARKFPVPWQYTLVAAICFGSSFQAMPAIVYPLILFGMLGALINLPNMMLRVETRWMMVFLLYNMLSGQILGGAVITDYFNTEFWDNDGRLYLAFIPLMLIPPPGTTYRIVGLRTRKLCVRLAAVFGILLVVWMSGMGRSFLGGERFAGFIYHKTNAGSYMALLSIFFFASALEAKIRKDFLISGVMLLGLLMTGSRQALLGYSFVILILSVRYFSLKIVLLVSAITLVGAISASYLESRALQRVTKIIDTESLYQIGAQWDLPAWEPKYDFTDQLSLAHGAEWNLVARVVFLKRGYELFMESPLFGVGFGRFNDPKGGDGIGVKGLAYFRVNDIPQFRARSAHNSLLHFMAELGIVGAAIFLIMLYYFFRRFLNIYLISRDTGHPIAVESLAGLLGGLFLIPSSFIGHAFSSPLVMYIWCFLTISIYTQERDFFDFLKQRSTGGTRL